MFELLVATGQTLGGLAFGVALALASIASTRFNSRRLRPEAAAARRLEVVAWAIYLVVAALIYVGFALREAGDGWMSVEVLGVLGYAGLAWLGLRRPRILALGWLLHAGWDMVIHAGVADDFVPLWYRWACLSFDVAAAAYVARLADARE
ncbi:MAG: hypothetical protein KC486_26675 [Myxococcales bacterium]|nr:hypothetical protein [Myxococcales bacterium]